MTDNEIIKALECCSQEDMCQSCPYGASCLDEKYVSILSKDALDLINRQKAEILNLKADKEALINGQETLQKNLPKVIGAEAIKEFAEKVDFLICTTPSVPNRCYRKLSAGIKKLLKEMVGDDNC